MASDVAAGNIGAIMPRGGVVERTTAPELRVQALFQDRYIGVVRKGHPLCKGKITPSRYVAGRHIYVSRDGLDRGPIDDALKSLKRVVTIVGASRTRWDWLGPPT